MATKAVLRLAGNSISVSFLAMSSVALAQMPASAKQTAATIDEIVVTAQKREQYLQYKPISVTAFTGEAITVSGAQSADLFETPYGRIDQPRFWGVQLHAEF